MNIRNINKTKSFIFQTIVIIIFNLFIDYAWSQIIPDKPSPPVLVNDFAQILSTDEKRILEQKLFNYERATSTEIAVVTIPSLDGNEISDYSTRLFEKWKIGKKEKDNGILITIAKEDRKIFIVTGYGMESIIPDIIAKRIIDQILTPFFKKGQFYKGLDEATEVITGLADGKFTADKVTYFQDNKINPLVLLLIICLILFLVIRAFFINNKYRRTHLSKGGVDFLTAMTFMSLFSGFGRHSTYNDFSHGKGDFGGGSFSGFGGGMTGGGGAGGSW